MFAGIGVLFLVWRWCTRGVLRMTFGSVASCDVDALPCTLGSPLNSASLRHSPSVLRCSPSLLLDLVMVDGELILC